jgi:hypothetical protein
MVDTSGTSGTVARLSVWYWLITVWLLIQMSLAGFSYARRLPWVIFDATLVDHVLFLTVFICKSSVIVCLLYRRAQAVYLLTIAFVASATGVIRWIDMNGFDNFIAVNLHGRLFDLVIMLAIIRYTARLKSRYVLR